MSRNTYNPNRNAMTVMGLREKVADLEKTVELLRNNISGLCLQNAERELLIARLVAVVKDSGAFYKGSRASTVVEQAEALQAKYGDVRPEAAK